MRKISLAILALFLFATPVKAANVSITQLPGYINYTDFKLSCSALNGTTAQFYSKKDGGSYTSFGSSINLTTSPCQVQVTGSQFGSEGKFWFKVSTDVGESETSTTLDTTGPSAVSDYGKERMNGNTMYKIHWKNPLDSDYVKVFIYRGEAGGFEADNSHKVAEMGGNPGDTMSWDDGGLDPNKEYFYAIRAIDHANNSSSLTGDVTTTTTTTTTGGSVAGASTGAGGVTTLPVEEGQVLGDEEATSAPEAASTENIIDQLKEGLTPIQKVGAGVGVLVLLVLAYLLFFRRKNTS